MREGPLEPLWPPRRRARGAHRARHARSRRHRRVPRALLEQRRCRPTERGRGDSNATSRDASEHQMGCPRAHSVRVRLERQGSTLGSFFFQRSCPRRRRLSGRGRDAVRLKGKMTVEQVQRAMNHAECNHYVGYRGAAGAALTIPLLQGARAVTWRREVRLLTPYVPRHPRIRGRLLESGT